MKDGSIVLAMLRYNSDVAIRAWGFVTRGNALTNPIGGPCTLKCGRFRESSVYEIMVDDTNGPDWYIPFEQGEARYCDVPAGEPNGTLVVTFPMNGCALEVHATEKGNRFYHDSDGKSMPKNLGEPKFRVDYAGYGTYTERVKNIKGEETGGTIVHRTAHDRSLRYFGPENEHRTYPYQGGYEHNIICVKKGDSWNVYASAVIVLTTMREVEETIRKTRDAWQVKDYVQYKVGAFLDA